MPRSLKEYERKRDFSKTKEPSGKGKKKSKARRKHPRFSFQKHSATSEHYDLRLQGSTRRPRSRPPCGSGSTECSRPGPSPRDPRSIHATSASPCALRTTRCNTS